MRINKQCSQLGNYVIICKYLAKTWNPKCYNSRMRINHLLKEILALCQGMITTVPYYGLGFGNEHTPPSNLVAIPN